MEPLASETKPPLASVNPTCDIHIPSTEASCHGHAWVLLGIVGIVASVLIEKCHVTRKQVNKKKG